MKTATFISDNCTAVCFYLLPHYFPGTTNQCYFEMKCRKLLKGYIGVYNANHDEEWSMTVSKYGNVPWLEAA